MKRFSLIALIAMIFLSSCVGGDAKKVAEKWLTAFWHLDYDAAEQYSTKETINVLKLFKSLDDKVLSDSAMNEAKKVTVSIKNIVEEGNNATVTYSTSIIPEDQTIYLVKENGQWLVQLTKEGVFGESDAAVDPDNNPNIVADTTTTQVTGDTSAADVNDHTEKENVEKATK
jgi:hypothetical protein